MLLSYGVALHKNIEEVDAQISIGGGN